MPIDAGDEKMVDRHKLNSKPKAFMNKNQYKSRVNSQTTHSTRI